jgi:hypothetical protein
MDLNYLLTREQQSLHMAQISKSKTVRWVHQAFARAYGIEIAAKGFPHRDSSATSIKIAQILPTLEEEGRVDDWESEGGSIVQLSSVGS